MATDVDTVRKDFRVSEVAASFGVTLEKNGDEWEACCPFHAEDTASFTVFLGKDRAERFHCFGCGKQGDVVDFVREIKGVSFLEAMTILNGGDAGANIKPREIANRRDIYAGIEIVPTTEVIEVGKRIRLYNPKRAGHKYEWGNFTPELVHPYRSTAGDLFGYVLRRKTDTGKETPMVCRVRLPNGDECWSRFPFPKPRPLYGLDKLRDGQQVIVVEGEKCVDYLRAATGRNVVGWAGGTQGAKHADWSPLAGRDVILWPDADAPGLSTMKAIGLELKSTAERIREIDVSGAPDSWDVADGIDDGWDRARIDKFMRDRIRPFEVARQEETPETPAECVEEPAGPVTAVAVVERAETRPVGADGVNALRGPYADVAFGSEVYLANEFMLTVTRAVEGPVVKADGKFWAFGPTSWREIPDQKLRLAVHGFDAIGVGLKGTPLKLGKRMIDGILAEFGTKVGDEKFFYDTTIGMNVRNGTIIIGPDGAASMKPHDPADRFRFTIDADFSLNGNAGVEEGTLLHRLIYGAFQDDPDRDDKIALIGEILGAAAFGLATKVKQPKAFVFLGETANNGKSTIMSLIECILPADAVSHLSPASFSDERKIVHLSGKAANIADELSATAISGEVFKAAVTGNPIEGRDLFKSAVTFRPTAINVFTTNVLPRFSGGLDRGLRRRLTVLKFCRVIPDDEVIPDIIDRIKREELDALLRFAVAGAQRLTARREYTQPGSSSEALREWLLLDPINEWFDQRIVVVPSEPLEGWHRTGRLYEDFKTWAIAEGYTAQFLPPVNTFGQRLKAMPNVQMTRRAQGAVALGITLNAGYSARGDDEGPF